MHQAKAHFIIKSVTKSATNDDKKKKSNVSNQLEKRDVDKVAQI